MKIYGRDQRNICSLLEIEPKSFAIALGHVKDDKILYRKNEAKRVRDERNKFLYNL